MSNGSTARCAGASPGWYVPRCRFRRTLPITSRLSNILFVTITSPRVQHYQDSSTLPQRSVANELSLLPSLYDHRATDHSFYIDTVLFSDRLTPVVGLENPLRSQLYAYWKQELR